MHTGTDSWFISFHTIFFLLIRLVYTLQCFFPSQFGVVRYENSSYKKIRTSHRERELSLSINNNINHNHHENHA